MKYTVILTTKPNGGIHVSVPALPDCTVEADSRDEALHLAREAITQFVKHSEITQVEVPQPLSPVPGNDVPWQWFGAFEKDASWDTLFDAIEQRREATRKNR
ncbi:MAG: type II toxin-antitoxin system HicB family antitoxin [Candidatus Binatia bacterium]